MAGSKAGVGTLIREINGRIADAQCQPRAIDVFAEAKRPGSRLIVDSNTGQTKAWPLYIPVPPGWYVMGAGIKQRCAA